jgi:arsenate reductase (glutaredoxin)
MIVYGIPNCNTVKKAMTWLTDHGFQPEFHDFKKKGITVEKLNQWCEIFGWEKVLNKKGTTWKKLDPQIQDSVKDQQSAVNVMLDYHSCIKRPIVEVDGKPLLLSFSEDAYRTVLIK